MSFPRLKLEQQRPRPENGFRDMKIAIWESPLRGSQTRGRRRHPGRSKQRCSRLRRQRHDRFVVLGHPGLYEGPRTTELRFKMEEEETANWLPLIWTVEIGEREELQSRSRFLLLSFL